jgi:perosamine synthetase
VRLLENLKNNMIYLTKPFFDNNEIIAVEKTFRSGWVAGQGPIGKELSEYIKNQTDTNFAIPVNNCTAGLHLALLAFGVKSGDEVIVSDYTFPATGHSVMFCGAKPRFVDVDLKTYNIDPKLIEEKINENTKAIIVVHEFGLMADMNPILKIAKKYDLKVIEDAACALGAKYNGKPVGSYGDITTFSFHARKNVTSGEGGIVVTNNEEYANIIKSLSCFGMESAYSRHRKFKIPTFRTLGYNYKLSDINASIALAQLRKYNKVLNKKRNLVNLYNGLLESNNFLTTPIEEKNKLHVYQNYAVVLDEKINRDKIILGLKEDGIQTQIGTYASHIQPVYNSDDLCPNSLFLFNQSLSLPLYYELQEDEVKYVVEKLNTNIMMQLKGN